MLLDSRWSPAASASLGFCTLAPAAGGVLAGGAPSAAGAPYAAGARPQAETVSGQVAAMILVTASKKAGVMPTAGRELKSCWSHWQLPGGAVKSPMAPQHWRLGRSAGFRAMMASSWAWVTVPDVFCGISLQCDVHPGHPSVQEAGRQAGHSGGQPAQLTSGCSHTRRGRGEVNALQQAALLLGSYSSPG